MPKSMRALSQARPLGSSASLPHGHLTFFGIKKCHGLRIVASDSKDP